jgi:hypothetical protein
MSRMVLGADSLMDMKLRIGVAAIGAVCCIESKAYFRIREICCVEMCQELIDIYLSKLVGLLIPTILVEESRHIRDLRQKMKL